MKDLTKKTSKYVLGLYCVPGIAFTLILGIVWILIDSFLLEGNFLASDDEEINVIPEDTAIFVTLLAGSSTLFYIQFI